MPWRRECFYPQIRNVWAKSSGHRRNMLLGGVSRYGIASAHGEDGRRYWVMVLGSE